MARTKQATRAQSGSSVNVYGGNSSTSFGLHSLLDKSIIPLINVDVLVFVKDFAVEVILNQTFENNLNETVEAVYSFPLEDNATINHFKVDF